MDQMKSAILAIISRRLNKLDSSTYTPTTIERAEAIGRELESLRDEIEKLHPAYACQKCGGTVFDGIIGKSISMKCNRCGAEAPASWKA